MISKAMCDDDMLISTIVKTALNTFKSEPNIFPKSLEQLAYMFNNIRSKHVNLHPMFMQDSTWTQKGKAPMTYIHMYSDNLINVGIFILKPNSKLPLHNHPQMFGLLKVLAGTVRLSSYSLNTDKTRKYTLESAGSHIRLVAERLEDAILDAEGKCCILKPETGNIHEIESLNGPAAFMDILSPPYDTVTEFGERKCSYFRAFKEFEPGVVELQEVETPSWFWSDSFKYTGPLITV